MNKIPTQKNIENSSPNTGRNLIPLPNTYCFIGVELSSGEHDICVHSNTPLPKVSGTAIPIFTSSCMKKDQNQNCQGNGNKFNPPTPMIKTI